MSDQGQVKDQDQENPEFPDSHPAGSTIPTLGPGHFSLSLIPDRLGPINCRAIYLSQRSAVRLRPLAVSRTIRTPLDLFKSCSGIYCQPKWLRNFIMLLTAIIGIRIVAAVSSVQHVLFTWRITLGFCRNGRPQATSKYPR